MFAGEVDLNNWYKPKIDKKILKDLSKRSDAKGIMDISIFCIALLFSGYLCFISWGTWWSIPSLLLYGNIFYCKAISVQHETNHETNTSLRIEFSCWDPHWVWPVGVRNALWSILNWYVEEESVIAY